MTAAPPWDRIPHQHPWACPPNAGSCCCDRSWILDHAYRRGVEDLQKRLAGIGGVGFSLASRMVEEEAANLLDPERVKGERE
jgi:hypothetical protein